MSIRRRLAAVLPAAVLALAAPAVAQAAPCANAGASPSEASLAEVRTATLCLLNRERTSRGLKALRAHARLDRSASRYSRDMVVRDFFSHVSPGGTTMLARIRAAGYLSGTRAYTVGENLAWGAGTYATPQQTVAGWMRSPGHRANILQRRFEEIGVGVAAGAPVTLRAAVANQAATYTTHFGARG